MASTTVSLTRAPPPSQPVANSLPQLLQTPSGLALLELQGTINLPDGSETAAVRIGRLDFPDYRPDAPDPAWMSRVYLYVGEHQRLTGEVKKLPRPVAVVRRKGGPGDGEDDDDDDGEGAVEELEVVEIVKYKLVFASRPEPVTSVVID